MTEADILSPAQVKRWLLTCYRPIRWDRIDEVGEAFREIDLVARQLDFDERTALLEIRFIVNRITSYEELQAGLVRIGARHGGRFVDYRLEVNHNLRRLQVDAFHAMEYRGPTEAEVITHFVPPGARPRGVYGEVVAAHIALYARRIGHGPNQDFDAGWL